jgi:hypothetical protein
LGRAFVLSSTSRSSRRWIDITLLATLSVVVLYFSARSALIPREPERGVAVVFAPWTKPDAAITRTVGLGARFVRFGGLSFIAVAIPDDREYPARALAEGAWLVVDPKAIAACLSPFGIGTEIL